MKCPSQDKKCYPTRTAAIKSALKCSRRRGTPLRVYWHKDCKSFHLSSKAARWGVDTNNAERETA